MKKIILIAIAMCVIFTSNADLIGHWALDEESGDIAHDTLRTHDGALMNYAGNSWTSGPIGGALGFDGRNNYVTMGKATTYEHLEHITICAWVNLTRNISDRHFIFGKPFLFKIDIERQRARFLLGNEWDNWSGDRQVSQKFLSLNKWYHIAATFDGDYKRIYINGENTDTMYAPLISGNIGTCSYDVSIGSRYTNSDGFNKYFKGYIDDVAIFDEALSQEDVFNVMTLGAVFFLETPTIPLDIKPGSCPNPVNVKSKGVLPVAILGTEEFDASTIDPASVRLNDIEPIRSSLEDVGAPLTDPNECECTTDGPDGFIDLSLKFKTQDIVESLGEVNTDDILMLPLTGVLNDGTSIEGEDCILIVGRFKPLNKADINGDGFVNAVDMAIVAENWLESSLIDN